MLITRDLLTRMGATGANADKYLDALNAALAVHGIDTELRIAHFLARQIDESDQTQQRQVAFQCGRRQLFRQGMQAPFGDRDHPQSVRRHRARDAR